MVKQGEEESEKKEEKNRQREQNCDGKKDWLDRKRLKIRLKKKGGKKIVEGEGKEYRRNKKRRNKKRRN